jgi:hypothetical protein
MRVETFIAGEISQDPGQLQVPCVTVNLVIDSPGSFNGFERLSISQYS